jgi:hypothetical protein
MGAVGEIREGEALGETQRTQPLPDQSLHPVNGLRHEQDAMRLRQATSRIGACRHADGP